MTTLSDRTEWLEADGLGGFASGTASGVRTRRYHALLLHATTPPTGRMVLVNGVDAFATTAAGRFALSSQRYAPDVIHPDGSSRIASFTADPWPSWEFELSDGTRIAHAVLVEHGTGIVLVAWRLLRGAGPVLLDVRPFLSGRDYHALHHENGAFRFEPEPHDASLLFRAYDGVPPVQVVGNGNFMSSPDWYRNFLYREEYERGLDAVEDLTSPGTFTWTLRDDEPEAVLILRAGLEEEHARMQSALARAEQIRRTERERRAALSSPLDRAADAYIVRRADGRSIVAGYPWFTDWGRDTFIAIRGLCLARNQLAPAAEILVEWAGAVSEGMIPNRFPDAGEAPEFNAVDASLWFVIAAHELLDRAEINTAVSADQRECLRTAIIQIVEGYARGTRYGIRGDDDGLLAAGEPGVQLTWMDARVGDRVITPRIGKPVEVQALWLNALHIAGVIDARWRDAFDRGLAAFNERFWNDERGCLFDVIDVDHLPGTADATVRPNQILAVGGLPVAILAGKRARAVVATVERELLTPFGLRSLAPSEAMYVSRYQGGPSERDAIYHQGIVWPWLLGPFVEAWVRVRRGTARARREARTRFLEPLLEHMRQSGGHLCEITDAEAPFTPRGCPFQAWSVGEIVRLDRDVLQQPRNARARVPSNVRGRGITSAAKPITSAAR